MAILLTVLPFSFGFIQVILLKDFLQKEKNLVIKAFPLILVSNRFASVLEPVCSILLNLIIRF
jgi:hypothetical protein